MMSASAARLLTLPKFLLTLVLLFASVQKSIPFIIDRSLHGRRFGGGGAVQQGRPGAGHPSTGTALSCDAESRPNDGKKRDGERPDDLPDPGVDDGGVADVDDNPFLNAATLLPEGVTFDDPLDELVALGGDPGFLDSDGDEGSERF